MSESRPGFTLLELILTIVIIGILTVALLPTFLDFTRQSKESAAKEMAHQWTTAVQTHQAKYLAVQGYLVTAGSPLWPTPASVWSNADSRLNNMPFLQAVPVNPLTRRSEIWPIYQEPIPADPIAALNCDQDLERNDSGFAYLYQSG